MADLQLPGPNHKEANCIPNELVTKLFHENLLLELTTQESCGNVYLMNFQAILYRARTDSSLTTGQKVILPSALVLVLLLTRRQLHQLPHVVLFQ